MFTLFVCVSLHAHCQQTKDTRYAYHDTWDNAVELRTAITPSESLQSLWVWVKSGEQNKIHENLVIYNLFLIISIAVQCKHKSSTMYTGRSTGKKTAELIIAVHAAVWLVLFENSVLIVEELACCVQLMVCNDDTTHISTGLFNHAVSAHHQLRYNIHLHIQSSVFFCASLSSWSFKSLRLLALLVCGDVLLLVVLLDTLWLLPERETGVFSSLSSLSFFGFFSFFCWQR